MPDEADQCPDEKETINGFEDGDGCADENPDNDGDGLSNAADLCPDQAEDLDGYQDSDGCPDPDNDGDGVLDAQDQCPDAQEVFNGVDDGDGCADEGGLVLLDLESGEIKLHQPLNFLSKKAVLEDDARAVLDAVATVIVARPDLLTVEVQVHTDDVGDPDFNLRFSDARAQIIRLYLTEKGVEEQRLTAKGYGESKPLMEGTSDEARSANRRVQFVILDRAEINPADKALKSDLVEPKGDGDETTPAEGKAKYGE
ncbi:MAG: OmpA family protein [Deltaproteobacteria bacterium]|nr:OmpA family protein [Deltaproteobacteria bacterium]